MSQQPVRSADIDKLRNIARACVDVHDSLERSGHFPFGCPERKFLIGSSQLLQDLADGFDAERNATHANGLPQDQRDSEAREARDHVAEIVPCYTPSGKRVALNTEHQHLPVGTKLYARPAPEALGAAKGVTVAELVDALETAYEAMNYLGDVLNDMDAVTEEDEKKTEPAFDKVRAILAKAKGDQS